MKTTDSILKRRSIRTYTGEPVDDATIAKIAAHIAGLSAPFGAACRIEIVRTTASTEPVRLGTYGAIRGATDFLALIVRDEGASAQKGALAQKGASAQKETSAQEGVASAQKGTSPQKVALAQEGAAYLFEQAILYCTSLGLGTCWLAGFFDRGGFKKTLSLLPGERLRSVSPIGYASDKPHRSLSTLLTGGKPTPRKPFSETFFRDNFGKPLTEDAAGVYQQPLEMVRRAPSANNKQTWRVVLSGDAAGCMSAGTDASVCPGATDATNALHFYKVPSMGYESLDAGIALCHFEQTCRELGIEGHYEVLSNAPQAPQKTKAAYVISWTK
jgi:nitroreductase